MQAGGSSLSSKRYLSRDDCLLNLYATFLLIAKSHGNIQNITLLAFQAFLHILCLCMYASCCCMSHA